MLAPILVFTYNRVNHFKRTIESLQRAHLAAESTLVIISDGAKDVVAEKSVEEIRNYSLNIKGFKSVELEFRDSNWGAIRSFKEAQVKYLNLFGKMIFMEDDNLIHPKALEFLNEALDFYEPDKSVFSISAYSVPLKFDTKDDFYFLPWYVPWVCATWKDKFLAFDWDVNLFGENILLEQNIQKMKQIGNFYYESALLDARGYSHAMDARINMHLFKENMVSVCPIRSLVQNIGNDGMGLNAGKTDRFDTRIDYDIQAPFRFHKFKSFDDGILSAQKRFMDKGWFSKLLNMFYIRRIYYIGAHYFPFLRQMVRKVKL
jgi:hypothetical protein